MATNAQRIQFLIAQQDGFTRSRLPALYSDFRSLRTTNPEGYAANVAAWRRALGSLVRGGMLPATAAVLAPSKSKGTPSASTASTAARSFLVLAAGQPLLDALQSDRYGRPLALDAVIQEAVLERDLVPLEAFLRAKESIYNRRSWSAWAAGLPWHAVSWGLHRLGVIEGNSQVQQKANAAAAGNAAAFSLLQGGGRLAPDQHVVLANVETAAAAFADKTADAQSPFEHVWSVAHFKRMFSAPGAVLAEDSGLPVGSAVEQPRLSDMDLNVLLAFLSRDKNLVVFDGHVVKLRGASTVSDHGNVITEEDRAVAQLRELIDSLTHQTGVLSKRIDNLTVAARDAVLRKNRVAALAALKQKKQAEGALTTRFATLAQLETTASQIEQASGQVQVVQAMAASADALKSLNAQVGGAEGVEEVVDRLRDQMDAADEINRILVDPTSANGMVVDEGEIDDELAALEKEEQQASEAAAQKGKEETQKAEAEVTRRKLEAAGAVPDNVRQEAPKTQEELEEETTKSLRNLSLKAEEPLPAN
ncbi:charged multivesicular body protein 7 [Sporothrix schenckii 1099-18]|uniref:Charged multivesicular body protein 7 n=1 Tax=Sporothrix schenckii 1099-18 TaxID=1397361 RepID=A0A0F2MI94_SPOSC|nr:charged multivesicular body protein 7 [Sporothrix schenckii 1099-18]KJR87901.1 charged multivesicular body protein 7 [Sporothrix schenckii 1099-18]